MMYSATLRRRSPLPILALLALAAGLTLTLVPHGRELALLRLAAGDAAGAVASLERLVADGDRSPATLSALARALARTGNVAAAAQLLERLAEERPGDRAVLEMLADLQRDAGRTEGLIRTLQSLQAIAPKIDRQRELAELLGQAGRKEERRLALRDLVQHFAAQPVDYVDLARAEQEAGDPAAGALVLQELAARHPEAADASVIGLRIGMLLAADQADQALQLGRQWLAGRSDLARVAPIIGGAFTVGGHPDLAVRVLETYAGPGADPELVAALAQAETDSGHPEQALQRLEQLGTTLKAMGTSKTALLRLRLALGLQAVDRANTAAEIIGLQQIPPDLLAGLSRLFLTAERTDALRHILASAGQSFLETDAVLAAQIFLAVGDIEAARRWSDRAAQGLPAQPDKVVALATVELRLGRLDRVMKMLKQAIAAPDLPTSTLIDIARIYIRAGHAAEGAAVLDALRRQQPSLAADIAWALAATASGQGREVGAWLAGHADQELSPDTLQDLAYLATDAGEMNLAINAAERLVTLRGSTGDALLLARTLLNAKQAKRALEQLRALPAGTPVPDDLREAVLLAAWRQGAAVGDELRTIWRGHLASAGTASQREAAIAMLLELRAYADVVPVLHQLAEQDPVHWIAVFSEAAAAAGQRSGLPAFWAETAMRPALPAEFRRQLAFRVLQAGDTPRAEHVFRALALTAPPRSPDVQMLLFLWGPRPSTQQLDWIEARAQRATAAEKAEWMTILNDHGAPARAIAIYRATPPADASDGQADAYAAALEAVGDRTALAAVLREQLPRVTSTDRLQRLAALAESSGDTELEWQALNKLVAAGKDGPKVQRRLGTVAFQRHDMKAAEQHLSRFVEATGGDYESLQLLGNISVRKRDTAGAQAWFGKGLQKLQQSGDQSFRAKTVEANLLHRLGQDDAATKLYERLVVERSTDLNLRADFVAMLMERGALQRARAVLGQQ